MSPLKIESGGESWEIGSRGGTQRIEKLRLYVSWNGDEPNNRVAAVVSLADDTAWDAWKFTRNKEQYDYFHTVWTEAKRAKGHLISSKRRIKMTFIEETTKTSG